MSDVDNVLPIRSLGGLPVSAIGYGAMGLSPGMYGPVDDERSLAALRHAMDSGVTLIDTSDAYGAGHNEELIGKAVRGRRDEIVVATKFGLAVPEGVEPHPFPVQYAFGELAVNAEPRHVRGYAEASLRRLGTDVIDLYYPHFPDPQVPLADTVGAVADLVSAGLVRHLGLSNVTSAEQLREAHATHPVAAVQVEWSLWTRPDPGLLAAADELGVGVVAWGPLGNGFLTGGVTKLGVDDFRANVPRFQAENLAANQDRFAPVREIAEQAGIPPSRLVLAWLLARHERVVPIPGSRTPAHIDDNLAAARTALPAEVLDELDRTAEKHRPVGASLLEPEG